MTQIDWSKVTSIVATKDGTRVNRSALGVPSALGGVTYFGFGGFCASGKYEPAGFKWLFNVIDSGGKVLFTEERGGTTEGWWPTKGAMIHAKALWEQFFSPSQATKARVCFQAVSMPLGAIDFWESPPAHACLFMGYDGSGWMKWDGQGTPPCPQILSKTIPTDVPIQDVTCVQACITVAETKKKLGTYSEAEYLACLKKCGPPDKPYTRKPFVPLLPITRPSYIPTTETVAPLPVPITPGPFPRVAGVGGVDWSKVTTCIATEHAPLVNKDAFVHRRAGALGRTCPSEPPDMVFAESPAAGVSQVAWFYSMLWQYDLGSAGWYQLKSRGPYIDHSPKEFHTQTGGAWPQAGEVLAKNPPWRYQLLWYWSTTGWKKYAEAYSYEVKDRFGEEVEIGDWNFLYC